jgi:oligogalacturonide lyase
MVEEGGEETTYGPQTSHPHPSFSPDGRWVAFTSDGTGYAQAFVVEVPEEFQ